MAHCFFDIITFQRYIFILLILGEIMTKVLVFGGAGYIGSHVVLSLLDEDYSVVVYDNLLNGWKENVPQGVEFIEGNILDKEKVYEAFRDNNIDAVIHLAGVKAAGESMENPGKYSENNISGTINIMNACIDNNVKNILFSSSATVYGCPEYTPIDENHKLNPENYYGFTKLEIERLLAWYSKLKDFNYVALRYFNAAGYDIENRVKGLEKDTGNLLPIVMEVASGKREGLKIFGDDYDTPDGTCVRDYVHVNDLAQGHALALKYLLNGKGNLIVNLGTGKGISVKEIVEKAREITGKTIKSEIVPRRLGDPAIVISSYDKAKEILGWEPKNSDVETLVRSMWKVYSEKD